MGNLLLLIIAIALGIIAVWLGVSYVKETLVKKNVFRKIRRNRK